MMSEIVIHTENLTRRFGDFVAVNNISFDVKAGEIFGFLGANGAGKTTAMKILCGLLSPTSGVASVAGSSGRVRWRLRSVAVLQMLIHQLLQLCLVPRWVRALVRAAAADWATNCRRVAADLDGVFTVFSITFFPSGFQLKLADKSSLTHTLASMLPTRESCISYS